MPDNTWTIYTPAYFILPHYQLTQVGDESWLTINIQVPRDEDPQEILPGLREALATRCQTLVDGNSAWNDAVPQATDVNYPMSYATWDQIIRSATERIKNSALRKVVLSRVAEICFDENVNVDAALDYLAEHYANCYRFLFEPRPHHAFYGATPELLARVEGQTLTTMGLAGTIRRGATEVEDEAYGWQILE